MAKTVAELSRYFELLSSRFEATLSELSELWEENEKLSEELHDARLEAVKHREELAFVRKHLDEARAVARDDERGNADPRQELALTRQRLDDYLKRVEVWSGRLWTLVVVLLGAVLSLASGLIVTLARK